MNNRLSFIDALKGGAIIGVLFAHFCLVFKCPISAIGSIAAVGARCPQLFFIISAFLTWTSLGKSDKVVTREFFKKRFIKIAPLFYLALLLMSFIPEMQSFSFANVATHVTFTNVFFPEYINGIMKVEWYIADLALFYISAPFLYKYISNLRCSIIAFCMSTLANIGFTFAINHYFAEEIAGNSAYEMYFHTFCIINQLPVMLIGVVLYYINKTLLDRPEAKRKLLIIGTVTVVLFLGSFVILHLNKKVITSSYIAGLIFGLLFLYLSIYQKNDKCCGLLQVLGKHSYGMYCLHMLIIRLAKHIPNIADNSSNIIMWSCLFVVILGLSYYLGWGAESITSIKYNSNKEL